MVEAVFGGEEIKALKNHTMHTTRTARAVLLASLSVLGLRLATAGHADDLRRISPPAVPGDLVVEDGNEPFLVGHAIGTQNYVCLPSGAAFAWSLFTPQATLFDDREHQVITHFFSPNPEEAGKPVRAAWQHSRDTSTVWARAIKMSTDEAFVAPGAIAWLLLNVKDTGAQDGPTGGDKLSDTTFIQRVNTVGGVAPPDGCATLADVGKRAFVPYLADYVFYEKERGHGHDDH
jgi:hypothetical protein